MPRARCGAGCGAGVVAHLAEAYTAARAKRDLMLRGFGVLGALLAALYIYSVIQGLGATLGPH